MQTQEGLGAAAPPWECCSAAGTPPPVPSAQRVRELPSPLPAQAGWPGPALLPPPWVALGFSLPGPQPGAAMPGGTRSPTRAPAASWAGSWAHPLVGRRGRGRKGCDGLSEKGFFMRHIPLV